MSEKTKQHHVFEHEFIDKENPIYGFDKKNTKALILGTIYPCKREECEKQKTRSTL